MMTIKETALEKVIASLPITLICFSLFIIYLVIFVKDSESDLLFYLTISTVLMSIILIFRSNIRRVNKPKAVFAKTTKSILDTPDDLRERSQRQKDADAKYFGSILFVISVMYMSIIELMKFY